MHTRGRGSPAITPRLYLPFCQGTYSVISLVLAKASSTQQRLLLSPAGFLATSPPSSRDGKGGRKPGSRHVTQHQRCLTNPANVRLVVGKWCPDVGAGEGRHGVARSPEDLGGNELSLPLCGGGQFHLPLPTSVSRRLEVMGRRWGEHQLRWPWNYMGGEETLGDRSARIFSLQLFLSTFHFEIIIVTQEIAQIPHRVLCTHDPPSPTSDILDYNVKTRK